MTMLMLKPALRLAATLLLATAAQLGAAQRPALPQGMPEFTGNPPAPTLPVADPGDPREVRATLLPGSPPQTARVSGATYAATGNIAFNFPSADVNAVAQAVLGDTLHVPFQVAPGLNTAVTLVTSQPVARGLVFAMFEDALRASGLVVTQNAGVFNIAALDAARGSGAVVGAAAQGFGTETIRLQFVSAAEMKRLLDPILPGVVSDIDVNRNQLLVSGTTGQRASVRDLLGQFDVNWLRGMSFALMVPQRSDARLIVPELEKLINGDGAPTKGLVRLITMERLNGILAISAQRQYLEDVRRWIEILDREGQNNEPRMFVYRVQNGRSKDLAHVLNVAFGNVSASDSEPSSPSGRDPFTTSNSNNNSAASRSGARQQSASGPQNLPGTPQPGGFGGSAINGSAAANVPVDGSSKSTSISSDEANNAIIVYGTPRAYALIEDALRKLDILPQQVLIEAAITEVTLNDKLRYGVQWNFQAGQTNFALTEGSSTTPSRTSPGFSFFFSNNSSISAALNALEEQTNVNVLSAPKLLVLNNQTATLQVGDQVPIATQSAVGVVNPGSPIVNSIEYRDTGVILRVTPRVNSGGLVLLDIAQEVSDVSATDTSTLNSPTISTRRIATSIAVQDGQVIALGGLIRDTKTQGKTGIPYLSRIPVIGGLLFGRTNDSEVRTELLVLLRPRVLRSIDDARAVTDELRLRIKSIEPAIRKTPIP